MHCAKHNHWYQKAKCDKCLTGEPPYKYSRDEVADPGEWKLFVKRGWTK